MNEKIPSTRWLRIIVPVLIACIMSFMDRVNISFALPGGMEADLGITSQMAGVASGIFFIGYLFLQIPGGRIAVNGSGKKFIAWSLVAWAIVSVATGFVTHQYQLLVLRFILGVSEGGMLPVVLTMVSNWFPEKELGRANAFVMMFAPLGGMLTAPVSGAIIAALDWRWLFIIEGLLSLVVLVVWWFMISDRPQEAHWLPARERDYLVTTLAAERAAKQAEAPVSKAPVKDVFGNAGLMKLVILNFFYQTGDYGYTLWLPTILKGLTGGNMASVGFLAVLPFVATLAGIYVISLFSDHSGKRRLWVRFSLYSFAAALVASVVLRDHMVAAYIALVLRLLSQIGYQSVLVDAGAYRFAGGGGQRTRGDQWPGQSRRILWPLSGGRDDVSLRPECGGLRPGRFVDYRRHNDLSATEAMRSGRQRF